MNDGAPASRDPLLEQLTNTALWLSEARQACASAQDTVRAMRAERRNRVAQAEEAFGVRRPR